ncbi:MAG: DJ-1 family glyoxalase III [Akkermansia sp.]
MKPILVLMATGFEEIELAAPVDILRRLDFEVVTAGVQSRRVEGAHGMIMEADMLLVDVDANLYDAIILPGGQASWLLRDTPAVLELVREMHAADKLVAAICAAPIALEAAGVLSGRKICCYPVPAVTDDIKSASEITNDTTVTSGNIVTGRGPGAALEFGFAVATALGKAKEVAAMREEMMMP